MLVLSRKQSETIVIGDEIYITIVEIRGDKVRLGVQMPQHISLHRKEIYDALNHARETEPAPSAATAPPSLAEVESLQQSIRDSQPTIERQQRTIERQQKLLCDLVDRIQHHLHSAASEI